MTDCTVIQATERILQAYSRLRTECCPTAVTPDLSNERCVIDIIFKAYFAIVEMMNNNECFNFHEGTRPDPPAAGCQIGEEGWLSAVADWMESITCDYDVECFDLGIYIRREVNPDAPALQTPHESKNCSCSNPTWTYQRNAQAWGDTIPYVYIGPFAWDVELYAKTELYVDDELVIDNVIWEPGEHQPTEGTPVCPSCNAAHTIEAGTVFGTITAGSTVLVTVNDQQGLEIMASGTICARRLH